MASFNEKYMEWYSQFDYENICKLPVWEADKLQEFKNLCKVYETKAIRIYKSLSNESDPDIINLVENGKRFACYQTLFDNLSSGILMTDFFNNNCDFEENPCLFLYVAATAMYEKDMELRGYVDTPVDGKPARFDGNRHWYTLYDGVGLRANNLYIMSRD
jgi:hypothetical protein